MAYFVISVTAFPIRILWDFSQEFTDHLFLLAYWLRIPAEKIKLQLNSSIIPFRIPIGIPIGKPKHVNKYLPSYTILCVALLSYIAFLIMLWNSYGKNEYAELIRFSYLKLAPWGSSALLWRIFLQGRRNHFGWMAPYWSALD